MLSDPKSVSSKQRLKDFPDEALTVFAGKLFRTACREELALKATVLKLHFQSRKHKDGRERLGCKGKRNKDIAEAFDAYSKEEHVAGETLLRDVQVYRVKVVTTSSKTGVPLNKLETFQKLLEENGHRLAGRRTMSNLILFICEQEVAKIKQEIARRKVSVINYSTTTVEL